MNQSQFPESHTESECAFCKIIAGRAPAIVEYEDEELIVIRNQLRWVPLMLLVIPKEHMSQNEMWESQVIVRVARIGVEMGSAYSPNGYRLLSNFGRKAMQSQSHAHLHVLGGRSLGAYV
jgi:histidine triad (HIT) family protein